jgi:small subunit ribosomal protein S6
LPSGSFSIFWGTEISGSRVPCPANPGYNSKGKGMRKKRNHYEVTMVVDAGLTDDESRAVLERHKEIIQKAGGVIKFESSWGRRKLAYEVKKQRFGIYYLLFMESDGDGIEEMERQFGYDDKVLKFFVVIVDDPEAAYNRFELLKQDPKRTANLISEKIGA